MSYYQRIGIHAASLVTGWAAVNIMKSKKINSQDALVAVGISTVASLIYNNLSVTLGRVVLAGAAVGFLYRTYENYWKARSLQELFSNALVGAAQFGGGALATITAGKCLHAFGKDLLEWADRHEYKGFTVVNGKFVPIYGLKNH